MTDDELERWRDEADERRHAVTERVEAYCDFCESEGHTFRSCPRRDDEGMFDEEA